ncbi:hypothetical protein GEMRC1_002637 [Eukaryota sp. GEM-RC1]
MSYCFITGTIHCATLEQFSASYGPPLFCLGITEHNSYSIQLYNWDLAKLPEPYLLAHVSISSKPVFLSFTNPDCKSLLCLTSNGHILIFSVQMTQSGFTLQPSHDQQLLHSSDFIQSADLSFQWQSLAIATHKGVYHVDLSSLSSTPIFHPVPSSPVVSVAVTFSNEILAGCLDGMVVNLSTKTSIHLHSPVTSISASPHNPRLFVGGLANGKCLALQLTEASKTVLTKLSCFSVCTSSLTGILFMGDDVIISSFAGKVTRVSHSALVNESDISDEGMSLLLSEEPLALVDTSINGLGSLLLTVSEASSIKLIPIE